MQIHRSIMVVAVAALAAVGCSKALPGGASVPSSRSVPNTNVPAGLSGASGEVDPNTCGNYAAMDGGNKLRAFLQATKDLERTAEETVHVVKQSCEMIGREMGMVDADFQGEAKDVCAKVYGTLRDNMRISFKVPTALHIQVTPAVCRVNVEAQAKAGADCEGHAGGSVSAQCRSAAAVKASLDVQCTEPQIIIEPDNQLMLDKTKAEMVVRAIKNGLPRALSIRAHLEPLQNAANVWAESAKELKDMGPKFVNSFKDQAMCIGGQLAGAVNLITKINANIHVSLEVSVQASATASGSAG